MAISGCAIGLVFGTLAGQAGLGAVESALMSALVFSGAAQFLVLGLWASPLPVVAIVLTTLVVGLRHLLMGAALGPVFSKLPRLKAYASVYFMADENWALTMGEFDKGRRDGAFLLGGGLLMFLVWKGLRWSGACSVARSRTPRAGASTSHSPPYSSPSSRGCGRGGPDLLPWTVAAAVSVAAHHWLPGQWYILLGGLAGSFAGVVRRGP